MRTAIPKLERRIKDLETFDVSTIRDRWDPVTEGLVKKVDGTIQEILGHGTVEYNEYSIDSLDTLPLIMGGGPHPLPEVHRGYREGIERALVKLRTLKEIFEERIADAPQATAPVAAHRPADRDGPEAGFYWVVVAKQQFPRQYRQWARMTVVGRVTGTQRYKEPVLSLLYVRGWGVSSAHHGVWENIDPQYSPSTPGGLKKN